MMKSTHFLDHCQECQGASPAKCPAPYIPQALQDAVSATPSENIEAHDVQIQDLQDAVSATPSENTEAYEVQVQDLQDAVSATPSENIKAHEVQLQDLQDAVSATPNRRSSEILTREPRGEKRPRGDTIISTHNRPPKADMEGKI